MLPQIWNPRHMLGFEEFKVSFSVFHLNNRFRTWTKTSTSTTWQLISTTRSVSPNQTTCRRHRPNQHRLQIKPRNPQLPSSKMSPHHLMKHRVSDFDNWLCCHSFVISFSPNVVKQLFILLSDNVLPMKPFEKQAPTAPHRFTAEELVPQNMVRKAKKVREKLNYFAKTHMKAILG